MENPFAKQNIQKANFNFEWMNQFFKSKCTSVIYSSQIKKSSEFKMKWNESSFDHLNILKSIVTLWKAWVAERKRWVFNLQFKKVDVAKKRIKITHCQNTEGHTN